MAETLEAAPQEGAESAGSHEPSSEPSTQPSSEAWTKEQQAAYTKKTQAFAGERKAFEARQKEFEARQKDWETQRENAIRQLQAAYQQIQHAQKPQGQQADLLEQIQQMDYIDGRTAHQLAQRFQQGLNPLNQSYQQLQKQNQWLYQELGKLQKSMADIQGGKRESEFNSLVSRTRAELGLPDSDAVTEAIKDVYLSHQDDDDLRENFTSLVRDRMDNLRQAFFEAAKQAASQPKKLPFSSPGGNVSPTGGSNRGRMTTEQIADMLFHPGEAEA